MPKHSSSVLLAHLALIIVNLIYGANFVIAKEVTPLYIKPFGLVVIRVAVAGTLFWIAHAFWQRLPISNQSLSQKIAGKDMVIIAFCAVFGIAINQLCFLKGLSLTAPINASLIMITTPIVVLIIAAVLIQERITTRKIVGIILGAIGAVLIIVFSHQQSNVNSGSLVGDVFIFLNASSYALYLVLVKPLMKKYDALTVIKWLFTFGFIYVLPFGYQEFNAIAWSAFPNYIWYCLLYIIVATTFITYLFNIFALQKVNASVVSIYIYTQPIIATTVAMALDKDHLSLLKIIAALFIFSGVFLVSQQKAVSQEQQTKEKNPTSKYQNPNERLMSSFFWM